MELLDKLADLLQNVGFPIVAWYVCSKQLDAERASHEKEASKWAETVNNNTAAVERLTTFLERSSNE